MMLTSSVWQDLNTLNKEFDRLFKTNDLDIMSNVEYLKDGRKVYIDLPGVKKEDIKVVVDRDYMVIEAERKGYISGKYKKSISLPNDVDTSNVKLSFEDGVLTIYLPLSESARPKTLYIE